MTVMLIWTLGIDSTRVDEARALVATRREQVRSHGVGSSKQVQSVLSRWSSRWL